MLGGGQGVYERGMIGVCGIDSLGSYERRREGQEAGVRLMR